MCPSRSVAFLIVTLAAATAGLDRVHAQQTTPLPVTDDAHQPVGIDAGAFRAYPTIETGMEITDNVFNAETGRQGDQGMFVAPGLRLESEWVRHELQVDVSSRHLYFFGNPSEDETQVNAAVNGRLDIFSRTSLEADAAYTLDQEGRGEVDVPGAAAEPPNEHEVSSSLALIHQFNRLEARVEGNFEYNAVENVDLVGGGTQNNEDRNYAEYGGQLRLGYDISPALQPFIQGGYSIRRHEQEIDDNGFRRDSEGYEASAGVRFELSPIVTGEVAVGYERRDFDDPALDAVEGVTVDANVIWQPSALTTVNFSASTGIEETATGASSGALVREFGVSVDHELRRHFLFGAEFGYSLRDFEGIALTEETWLFAAGLTYQLNRQFALRAGYSYEVFDSSIAGNDYTVNLVELGLLWQR